MAVVYPTGEILGYPLNGYEYNAEQAMTYLSTRGSGVYSGKGEYDLTVTGDFQVTLSPGRAWMQYEKFRGLSVASENPVVLAVDPPDAVLSRKDRVVLRFDKSKNKPEVAVIKGNLGGVPEAPAIVRNGVIYDLGLFIIDVKAGAAALRVQDISDTRMDESVCGVMRDGVTGLPTEQIQRQAEDLISDIRKSAEDASAKLIPDGAVTVPKLAAETLLRTIFPATVARSGNNWAVSVSDAPSAHAYTIRFVATANYVKGDAMTVNGVSQALAMTNGKPLPANAWVTGAVVDLKVDPTGKKAFFSGGGADLSFVTAGAGQIMAGFVGANPDGEPVRGTRTTKVTVFGKNVISTSFDDVRYLHTMVIKINPKLYDELVIVVDGYMSNPETGYGYDVGFSIDYCVLNHKFKHQAMYGNQINGYEDRVSIGGPTTYGRDNIFTVVESQTSITFTSVLGYSLMDDNLFVEEAQIYAIKF